MDPLEGYDGWIAPERQSDEGRLEQDANECRLATAAVDDVSLDAKPAWWFEDSGDPPHPSLREILLYVLVETATHAGTWTSVVSWSTVDSAPSRTSRRAETHTPGSLASYLSANALVGVDRPFLQPRPGS